MIDRVVGKTPENRHVDVNVTKFQELVESSELVVDLVDVDVLEIEDGT